MSQSDSLPESCIDQIINVITTDGKVLIGTLKGIDKSTNLILDDSHERVFSLKGAEKHYLGLCLLSGSNVALIGQLEGNPSLDLSQCKAKPLKPITH